MLGVSFIKIEKSYDFPDYRLAKENAWVRVRDEGDRTVMTYKQRLGANSHTAGDNGMHEIEIIVNDFNNADNLLKSIGMIEKFYEENKRERYVLDGVEIDIDTWPMIPTYVEIEGDSWENVQNTAEKLGFNWENHLRCLQCKYMKNMRSMRMIIV